MVTHQQKRETGSANGLQPYVRAKRHSELYFKRIPCIPPQETERKQGAAARLISLLVVHGSCAGSGQ